MWENQQLACSTTTQFLLDFWHVQCMSTYDAMYIAANPPDFFIIIRKSKLEYKVLNDDFFFRIMKIRFFLLLFSLSFFLSSSSSLLLLLLRSSIGGRRRSMTACRNQHSRAFSDFVLQRMRCMLQFTSCPCLFVSLLNV